MGCRWIRDTYTHQRNHRIAGNRFVKDNAQSFPAFHPVRGRDGVHGPFLQGEVWTLDESGTSFVEGRTGSPTS